MSRQSASTRCLGGLTYLLHLSHIRRHDARDRAGRHHPAVAARGLKHAQLANAVGQQRLAELAEELEAEEL